MRVVRHPLVQRDLVALVDHIVETTQGDLAAASRRLDEVEDLLAEIVANPFSGTRLAPPLDGWLVRHGGKGRRITLVFRADPDGGQIFIALVAFGGQDWMTQGASRRAFAEPGW